MKAPSAAFLVSALVALELAPLTALAPQVARAENAPGSVFEVAQVLTEIKRQLTAAEAGAGGLRIEDAQLDLALVEAPGGRGGAFVIPGADYGSGGKDEPSRPVLKRRIVLEVQPAKAPLAGASASASPVTDGPAASPGGGGGRLAQAINDVRAGVAQTLAADPAYDLKRFTIDLDFALERDGKGAVQLVLFARDRRIDAGNVHDLRLRLASPTKDKDPRGKQTAGK
ncbi:MAG: hypothetical protein U1E42_14015 [Rhodospirillales bacterium]